MGGRGGKGLALGGQGGRGIYWANGRRVCLDSASITKNGDRTRNASEPPLLERNIDFGIAAGRGDANGGNDLIKMLAHQPPGGVPENHY